MNCKLTCIMEDHRKGTKLSLHCSVHGYIGHRFIAQEANDLAEAHVQMYANAA